MEWDAGEHTGKLEGSIMLKRARGILPLALMAALPLLACDGGTGTETGTLDILLTDAPGDFVQAVVTIDRIYLQPDATDQGTGDGLDRVDLMTTQTTQDLLSLANATAELVSGAEVPAGWYAQLRLVVSDACIEVENDAGGTEIHATRMDYLECGTPTGQLQTPSFDQTGIKVQLPGDALEVTGTQKILLVDFDVGDSFGHDTGMGTWVMQPVIHGSEVELTGGIDVTLELGADLALPDGFALGDFEATLDTEVVPVAFTDADSDGVYEASFLFLDPADGPFDVGVAGPDGLAWTLDPAAPQTVSLSSGGQETVAFTVTAVELPAQ